MKRFFICLMLSVMLIVAVPAMAQETPAVEVSDQVSLNGTVRIDSIYSEVPGFIVIHQDDGSGSFGAVIGHRQINAGWSFRVDVPIDASMATTTLYAMLHVDTGEAGVYEFGTVEGADGPVVVDGAPVSPGFNVDVISAWAQIVDSSVTIANITAQVDGFIVIHADNDGAFGDVIGSAPVSAGQNSDVVVEVDAASVTDILWPMLHVDTGEIGVYEFGTVEGADGPVVVGNSVAVTTISTVSQMQIDNQIIMHGDGMDMMDMAPTLVARTILAEVDGFLVVHAEADGGPGPVAGFAPVSAGINTNVMVELDPDVITPRLWPMLHVDTGEAGVYEFGTVEGADGPVTVNGNVLTFGINAAPSLTMVDQPIIEAMMGNGPHIYIENALIDGAGWIAVHSSVDGSPGPVIATAPIIYGSNNRVLIELDPADAGTQVFPMLHYDTNELGVYEFGTVDGADGPVSVAGSVIVGPINITEGMGEMEDMGDMSDESMTDETMTDEAMTDESMTDESMTDESMTDETMTDETMTDETMMTACTVSAIGASVNLRTGASTSTEIAGSLTSSDVAEVNGQAFGSDRMIWWSLVRGSWVRSDIVAETGDCDNVPTLESNMGDMDEVIEPAATEEAGA